MLLPKIVSVGIYDSSLRPALKNTINSQSRKASMFEIELPIEYGGICYIDSNAKQITPHTIICVKPGQIRYTKLPIKCYFVHLLLHSGVLYDTLMSTSDFFETNHSTIYKDIFENLIKYNNRFTDDEEIILYSKLLELIYTISKDFRSKVKISHTTNSFSKIEQSLTFINEHLTEDLRLECVAKSVSLSPIHFHNTFKTAVGKTLHDYIEEQRIKKAITLLLESNLSLTQIAYECGFSSQSYFSYVFKRRMKVTPRHYVQEIHENYEINTGL